MSWEWSQKHVCMLPLKRHCVLAQTNSLIKMGPYFAVFFQRPVVLSRKHFFYVFLHILQVLVRSLTKLAKNQWEEILVGLETHTLPVAPFSLQHCDCCWISGLNSWLLAIKFLRYRPSLSPAIPYPACNSRSRLEVCNFLFFQFLHCSQMQKATLL